MSGVTDCYQPAEREFRVTRGVVAVAAECRQPIAIVTKNALVTRDVDLLAELAAHDAVRVSISITTLDAELARKLEPRTSTPQARLRAIRELSSAGVPTWLMCAPVIPGLTDSHMPEVMAAAREAGATSAYYELLRLPSTVQQVFFDWVRRSYPDRYDRVETLVRSTRGGRLNQSEFGLRGRGTGPVADVVAKAFGVWRAKLGFDTDPPPLNTADFHPARPASGQMSLF